MRSEPSRASVAADLLPSEAEELRLLLQGDSVIDWHRLHFPSLEEVDRFLRLNELDPASPTDLRRLDELRRDAVTYLDRVLGHTVPREVGRDTSVRELFLVASRGGRLGRSACAVLKVIHVMHHLVGQVLLVKLPVSDDEIFHLVEAKVVRVVETLRAAGHDIVEFAWGRKHPDGLITKLLVKRANLAAHVYDKLRFRLVTRREADLVPLLRELLHRLVPFNYVLPGESANGLVTLDDSTRPVPGPGGARAMPPPGALYSSVNEFSGDAYRVVSFVADLPVRLDRFLAEQFPRRAQEPGAVVFVLTEFQVMDEATARHNEEGESNHARYKGRQHARVRSRLGIAASGALSTQPPDQGGVAPEPTAPPRKT